MSSSMQRFHHFWASDTELGSSATEAVHPTKLDDITKLTIAVKEASFNKVVMIVPFVFVYGMQITYHHSALWRSEIRSA